MKAEDHIKAFEEYKRNIFRWALDIQGIENSQRTIGFSASRGIVELLSAYLHRTHKIDEGFQINHRWFKSGSVAERLPEFENKDAIVRKMVELENLCENLSYGSPKPMKDLEGVVKLFREIEEMIKGVMGYEEE